RSGAQSASSTAIRSISLSKISDGLASFNVGPATKAPAARSHQRWARWVLPQPGGPCKTSAGAGQAGHRSIHSTANLLLSDTKKSDRVLAVGREKWKAIWLTHSSQCLFGTRQNSSPAHQVRKARQHRRRGDGGGQVRFEP